MPHAYTEDQLVEQPAKKLFAELGWVTVSALEEEFGTDTGTLGRETSAEVVLQFRLALALVQLNPKMPVEALDTAIKEMTRDRSAMSPAAANRELYRLIKDGVRVDMAGRGTTTEIPRQARNDNRNEEESIVRVKIIDWDNPANNDFVLVSQMTVTGPLYTCRPDLIGFVNGLPLVVIELKKPGVPARQAFDENLTSYKHPQNGIPALFWYNALLIASNGTESRVGSLTADWERFAEWKRIEREDEPRKVSLETVIRGTCEPSRLLDIIENFTLFSEHKSGLTKIIAQNHQFLGVNAAIASMVKVRSEAVGRDGSPSRPQSEGRAGPPSRPQLLSEAALAARAPYQEPNPNGIGVFWQTQGSGKSYSMVFFAQKVLRKVPGNWSFVVVTDRVELDDQIARTFAACGAVTDAGECHASSGAHLRELLGGNNRYVFTLIHKFQSTDMLCAKRDLIVMTDEAHRSQYDTLAVNMRSALPNALFLAFTGTPLIAGEERTKDVFGDYVSIYDFQQSVEDAATVPLYYENRTPELQLVNPDLNEDIYQLVEDAGLSEEAEAKLQKELGRQYHIITRDDRLEKIAQDIVRHFLGRGFVGKAMVVSIDKATALRMHDKVRQHWQAELVRVRKELARYDLPAAAKPTLEQRLEILTTTDMALIVSAAQNEVEQMKKLGLDIVPHRKRMNDEALDEKFKDPQDPLRLVFLCAMWLTGFDAPSCSTVYLDKPMRNHTLMQTIARANRVFPGKHSGVIVDYANVFTSLERALAIYGQGQDGTKPVKDKQQLVEALRQAVDAATIYCANKGVTLAAIEQLPAGDLRRLQRIDDAVNALIAPDKVRKEFLAHERLATTLYNAVKPDPCVVEFMPRAYSLAAIGEAIRAKLNPTPADISRVMGQIAKTLDDSITGMRIKEDGPPPIDLSKINFAALRDRFKESKHKNTDLEQLKAAIRAQLEKLIRFNRSRADYMAKFEELIEAYNNGSRNIEQTLEDLLLFAEGLSVEQERHVREHLSEEELTIFDILTRPAPPLSPEEREEVRKVAQQLLARLKGLLVLEWRAQTQTRARVIETIKDTLDTGLPGKYSKELYAGKCSALFEHVFESYQGEGASIYTTTA